VLTPPLLPPLQVNVAGSVTLVSGTTYWIVGEGLGSAFGVWPDNIQGTEGRRAYRHPGEAWFINPTTMPAFRIEVTPGGAGCPADMDGNGHVEPADVAYFVNTWITSLSTYTLSGDFDRNGAVEPADVALFISTRLAALASGC